MVEKPSDYAELELRVVSDEMRRGMEREALMKKGKYILIIEDDIEPRVSKRFLTGEERDEAARNHRRERGPEDGVFALDIDWKERTIEVFSYGAGEMEEEDDG